MAAVRAEAAPARRWVTCGGCKHFRRDTEGPSYNAETHVYFMGVCDLGLKSDTPVKQFAERKRECGKWCAT